MPATVHQRCCIESASTHRGLAPAIQQSRKCARTRVEVRCERARVQSRFRNQSPMSLQLSGTLVPGTRAYPRTGHWAYANLLFPLRWESRRTAFGWLSHVAEKRSCGPAVQAASRPSQEKESSKLALINSKRNCSGQRSKDARVVRRWSCRNGLSSAVGRVYSAPALHGEHVLLTALSQHSFRRLVPSRTPRRRGPILSVYFHNSNPVAGCGGISSLFCR